VPKDEGKAIIDRYFERFPGIRAYHPQHAGLRREHGFTQTLFGRKTHFEPNIRSPNPSIRAGAERAAINAPIQGTSADLIKRAMARMDDALAEAGLEDVGCCCRSTTSWCSKCRTARGRRAAVIRR
jgi:DNA polymerase-1